MKTIPFKCTLVFLWLLTSLTLGSPLHWWFSLLFFSFLKFSYMKITTISIEQKDFNFRVRSARAQTWLMLDYVLENRFSECVFKTINQLTEWWIEEHGLCCVTHVTVCRNYSQLAMPCWNVITTPCQKSLQQKFPSIGKHRRLETIHQTWYLCWVEGNILVRGLKIIPCSYATPATTVLKLILSCKWELWRIQ